MLSQTHTNTHCMRVWQWQWERIYREKDGALSALFVCVCARVQPTLSQWRMWQQHQPWQETLQLTGGGPRVCVCVCDSVCMLSQYRERKALTPQPFYSIFILWCRQTHSRGHAINQYQYDRCVRVCIYVRMCTLTQLKTIKGIVHPKIVNLSTFAHPNIDI